MPELVCSADDPRQQDDTRSRSRSAGTLVCAPAQDGEAGDCTRDIPRAAGAASARGAQSPADGPDLDALAVELAQMRAVTARLNYLARRQTRAHKSDIPDA